METLYFAGFCVFIGLIIFWGFRTDDFAEFNDAVKDKRFSIGAKKTVKKPKKAEEDEPPKANLL